MFVALCVRVCHDRREERDMPLIDIRRLGWESHKVISRMRLLGLEMVAERQDHLLEASNVFLGANLVLSSGFKVVGSLILSLLLNGDSPFQNAVFVESLFVVRLETRQGRLEIGLCVFEVLNLRSLRFHDAFEVVRLVLSGAGSLLSASLQGC